MKKEDFRIVFMGTPEFAVESLKRLVGDAYNVVAVITAADKAAGRGKKIRYSAVKEFALKHNLRLFQPVNLKSEAFISDLRAVKADLQIVVAFRMLPEVVWYMPDKGTFNLHASLLPQYRGAAPINHAIINGEKKTGLTTFFLDKQIDTGKIIRQTELEIFSDEDAGKLHDRMMFKGAELVLETVKAIVEDNVTSTVQSNLVSENEVLKPAPKIFKEDCAINWNKPANEIYNFIRGLSPYPGAYTTLYSEGNKPIYIKVYASNIEKVKHNDKLGTVLWDNREMKIAAKDAYVHLLEIQQSGKRRMKVSDFLRGVKLEINYEAELI